MIIGLLIGLIVCVSDSMSAPESQTKSRVIIMGLDDTGSYTLWEDAKKFAAMIVFQMVPGDIFYLRRITATSYSDDCTLFRLELPEAQVIESNNPYDRVAKKKRKIAAYRIHHLKKLALREIAMLQTTGAKKTDIQGFLAVATEKFAAQDSNHHRLLLIASDLQENVRYAPELNLKDVRVAVVGFQPLPNPKKTQNLKKYWTKYFSNLGARRTQFIRADENIQLERL
ncbi:uncharacterized protein Dvar_51410 [Desulfosarcina variabilis str. Montpellier]